MSDAKPKKEKKDKFDISQESAESQFDEMLDYFDMAFSDIEIEDGEKAALTMKNFLVRSIRRGRLEITTEGGLKIVHHLDHPTEQTSDLNYNVKRIGIARKASRKAGKKDDPAALFMATLCDVQATELMKLQGADITTHSRLETIFSMV